MYLWLSINIALDLAITAALTCLLGGELVSGARALAGGATPSPRSWQRTPIRMRAVRAT
jgi:hypothetical protein